MLIDCVAYIDPGAGSIILQFLAAITIGVSVMFRRSVAGFFRIFRRTPKLPTSGSSSGE